MINLSTFILANNAYALKQNNQHKNKK